MIGGVFLGKSGTSEVLQSIPLFHTWALAPTVTVGLALVAEFAKSADLEIVGFYASTSAVLKSLMTFLPSGVGKGSKAGVGAVLEVSGDLVVEGNGKVEVDDKKMEIAINEGAYLDIVDFDDHLEDPRKDFLGSAVLLVQ